MKKQKSILVAFLFLLIGTSCKNLQGPSPDDEVPPPKEVYIDSGNPDYSLDTTPPEIVANLKIQGATETVFYHSSTSAVFITWDSSNDEGFGISHYQIDSNNDGNPDVDNIAGTNYSKAFAVGTHWVAVRAVDKSGNHGGWSSQVTLIIDETLIPAVSGITVTAATDPGAGLMKYLAVAGTQTISWPEVTVGTAGLKHYEVTLNGSPYYPVTNSMPFNFVTATFYSIQVRAVDNTGKAGAWSSVYILLVDAVGPGTPSNIKIAGKSPVSSVIYYNAFGDLTVSWDASVDDASGVSYYQLWMGGSQSGTNIPAGTTTVIRNFPSDGTYSNIYVKAFDSVGNETNSTAIQFLIDSTSPTNPSIPLPGADGFKNASQANDVSFNVTAGSDSGSGVQQSNYYIMESGVSVYSSSLSGSSETIQVNTKVPLVDGKIYKIGVQTIDKSGNASAWVISNNITYDATPPVQPAVTEFLDEASNGYAVIGWNPSNDATSGLKEYHIVLKRNTDGKTAEFTIPVFSNGKLDVDGITVAQPGGIILDSVSPFELLDDKINGTSPSEYKIRLKVTDLGIDYSVSIKAVDYAGNETALLDFASAVVIN